MIFYSFESYALKHRNMKYQIHGKTKINIVLVHSQYC